MTTTAAEDRGKPYNDPWANAVVLGRGGVLGRMWIDAEMLHITMYKSVFQNTTEAGDVELEYSCLVVNSLLEEERFRQLQSVMVLSLHTDARRHFDRYKLWG